MFDKLKKQLSSFIDGTKKAIFKDDKDSLKDQQENKQEVQKNIQKDDSKGLLEKAKMFVKGEVILSEEILEEPLYNLELSLLSSGVEMNVASELIENIKQKIVGKKVKKKEIDQFLLNSLKDSISSLLERDRKDIIINKTPYVILFIGPNGAGKTTTIAKFIKKFKEKGKKVVVAAADTFRAAAIEQLEKHADILGAKLIKGAYGSDPASIAYSAIEYARSNKYDVVLIDTAGRQEINKNLMNELKKIKRVAKPDFTIYVTEALVGNALINQIKGFKELGIDGIVLTKLDLDKKGGAVISIEKSLDIDILYFTTGQEYDQLRRFDKELVLDRLFNS